MHEPVLVLNANYQPLNICTTKRAMGLIFSGKANMLLNGRGVINTVSREFPRPSVIRLGYMVRRPRHRVALTKREVFRRDHYSCQYCGTRTNDLTLDHVLPKHMGGRHEWSNLVAACANCNLKKGGRTLRQSGMSLRRQPFEPKASALYVFQSHLDDNEEWKQFLEGW